MTAALHCPCCDAMERRRTVRHDPREGQQSFDDLYDAFVGPVATALGAANLLEAMKGRKLAVQTGERRAA